MAEQLSVAADERAPHQQQTIGVVTQGGLSFTEHEPRPQCLRPTHAHHRRARHVRAPARRPMLAELPAYGGQPSAQACRPAGRQIPPAPRARYLGMPWKLASGETGVRVWARQALAQARKGADNIMNAIRTGMVTAGTKASPWHPGVLQRLRLSKRSSALNSTTSCRVRVSSTAAMWSASFRSRTSQARGRRSSSWSAVETASSRKTTHHAGIKNAGLAGVCQLTLVAGARSERFFLPYDESNWCTNGVIRVTLPLESGTNSQVKNWPA